MADTDFNDILDHWQKQGKGRYRFEGDTGVRNFEQLVKDIGYDQGIENFLADNPGAIETLLEWISEHAEKGGSEWKENLAEACDYQEDEEQEDENYEEDGDIFLTEHSNDGTNWIKIGTWLLDSQEQGEELVEQFQNTSKFVITKNGKTIKEFLPKE
jgi:hypothetical protein